MIVSHGLLTCRENTQLLLSVFSLFVRNASMVYCLRLYKLFRQEDQKVLASFTAGEQRTAFQMARKNSPVNEHSRLCGDHFEVDCFRKISGSSRVNLKPGSIPTKFCFVEEKTPRKSPAEQKSVERKQPFLYVNSPSNNMAECKMTTWSLRSNSRRKNGCEGE